MPPTDQRGPKATILGSLRGALGALLGPGKPVRHYSDLSPGRCAIEGVLAVVTPAQSPLGRTRCAAFRYRAFYTATRSSGMRRQLLMERFVCGQGLRLQLEGGEVGLHPQKADSFGRDDHLALKRKDMKGFRAVEHLLRAGAQVRATGKLRHGPGGQWVLGFDFLERIEAGGDPG